MGAIRVTALYTCGETGRVAILVDGKPVHETYGVTPSAAKAMLLDVFRGMALEVIVSDGETEEVTE